MPFLLISAFLLAIAYPMIGTTAAVGVLVCSQILLLAKEIRTGQITGVGGFIFMSILFFSVRPIYMVIEKDYTLFTKLFLIRVDLTEVTSAVWWASLALWCFAVGAAAVPVWNRRRLLERWQRNKSVTTRLDVRPAYIWVTLGLQVATMPVMFVLVIYGRRLYRSALGAYAYDLPVVLQSIHVLAVVIAVAQWTKCRDLRSGVPVALSGGMLLVFAYLMRDVSNFRSFYIMGLLIAGFAVLQILKGRVGYAWLIVPVIFFQPLFQYLGQQRGMQNEELLEEGVLEQVVPDKSIADAYWNFYGYDGDMNIFDTFVAAKRSEPAYYPYVWSWLYVPLHFVPRALWKAKPKGGITQDGSFTRGAPYSCGIAGFFLLDGGLLWMLGSMFVLGYLVSMADWWVLTLPRGYLRCCLIGVLTVNGMLLSRFFLWQYFYQVLYYVTPILLLSWWIAKMSGKSTASRRSSHRRPRPSAAPVGA